VRMQQRRHRVGTITAALLLPALLLSTTPAPAAGDTAWQDEVDPESAPLRDGEWLGSFAASGPATVTFGDETSVNLTTVMDGSVGFRTVDGVVADGDWMLWGSSAGRLFNVEIGGAGVRNTFEGSGPVTGDVTGLRLGGAVDTTWTLTFDLGGSDTSQDPTRLGPFDVNLTATSCRRVIGVWQTSFASEIAAAGGWQSNLNGSFEAVWQGDDDPDPTLRDRADQLLGDYNAWAAGVNEALSSEEGWELTPAARDVIEGFITEAVDLEAAIHDQDADEVCIFGDRLGLYSFALTGSVMNLVMLLLTTAPPDAFDGAALNGLADLLLSVGGIGPAAPLPDVVAAIEQGFVERMEALLEPYIVYDAEPTVGSDTCDPCLVLSDDVVAVALLVNRLGLTIPLDGQDLTPEHAAEILVTQGVEVDG